MRLRYIGLGVEQLQPEIEFLTDDWQLEPVGETGCHQRFTVPLAVDPFVLQVREAAHNRVDVFAFEAEDDPEVDSLFANVVASGANVVDEPGASPTSTSGYGFRFFDPDGHFVEISSGEPPVPQRPTDDRAGRPLELSHYVINSTDNAGLADWYCETLGFRITDRLEDKLVFLTTTGLHHQVAIASSSSNGLNHIAFECRDVDEFMRATGRLQRRGHRLLWGPGRHGPGDNTYAYFRDPAGFVQEYTTGLEPVDAPDWKPRMWQSVPEQSDLWGTSNPRPNEEFSGVADPGLFHVPGGKGEM